MGLNGFFWEVLVEFFDFGVYVYTAIGLVFVFGVVIVVVILGWVELVQQRDFGDNGVFEFTGLI